MTNENNEIVHLRELLEEKQKSTERALELQAKEYERRLHDLNDAAEEKKHLLSTLLPRETYEKDQLLLNLKVDTLQKILWIGVGICLVVEILFKVKG